MSPSYPSGMGRILTTDDLRVELRRLRKARGLTQVEAARQAKVGQSAISDWETGEVVPTLPNLLEYLTALGAALELLPANADRLQEAASALTPRELDDLAAFVRRVGGESGDVRSVLLNMIRAQTQQGRSAP